MISRGRIIPSVFFAWLVFLTLDFLAHASLLSSIWEQGHPALKAKGELFRLIPLGYLSFLFLTILVGWLYKRIFGSEGSAIKGLLFGATFGSLFALSNGLGWYSFLSLPLDFVVWVSLVYFVELAAVGLVFGLLMHPVSLRKRIWLLTGFVILGFVIGIVLQNL